MSLIDSLRNWGESLFTSKKAYIAQQAAIGAICRFFSLVGGGLNQILQAIGGGLCHLNLRKLFGVCGEVCYA